ncbi:unnamed protein product [Blepharisma stoltei]|uniref:Uncharacterized protein n=1 Tax=Blepharisma stoltei TaxID=1481888 RepID=A0AAU9JQ69_9CILI|nr:unnamed protein product [Blepharisma stoltei]
MSTVRILSTCESILEALDKSISLSHLQIKAMYNSMIGGIITDPAFMTIPIDDHMVHRGHVVFDTVSIVNGRAFTLQSHVNKIIRAATNAKIELPLSKEAMSSSLKQLAASAGLRSCKIKYWISAGPGSMFIQPYPGMSVFYAIVLEGDARNENQDISKEFTVNIPLNPRFLETMKSTNYLFNALSQVESKEKGGFMGIQKTQEGYIAESSIWKIGFVLPGGRFVIAANKDDAQDEEDQLILAHANELLSQGKLSSVGKRKIHIDEAKNCEEMFLSISDTIRPVLEWDGMLIGNGTRGRISQELIDYLQHDFANPDLSESIPYELYEATP